MKPVTRSSADQNNVRKEFLIRLPVVLVFGMICSACVSPKGMYATPSYDTITSDLPFKANYPVAREIHYLFFYRQQHDDEEPSVAFAQDGEVMASAEEVREATSSSLYNADVSAGTNWVDIHQRQADYYKASGNDEMAAISSQAAANAMAIDNSFNQALSSVQLAFSTYDALIVGGQAFLDWAQVDEGNKVADFVSNHLGAVGESAPAGSKLEVVYIREFTFGDHQDYAAVWCSHKWTAVVTLDDGNGRITRSSRSATIYCPPKDMNYGEDETPEELSHLIYVGTDFVPISTGKDYSEAKASIKELQEGPGKRWGHRQLMVISSAVKDLYSKLESLQKLEQPQ